jgi:hypothetical protein
MALFSIRYRKALIEKRLRVTMSSRLRGRVWLILQDFDLEVGSGWDSRSSVLYEAERSLKKAFGDEKLMVRDQASDQWQATDLKGFVASTYPSQVLDVIEAVHATLWDEQRSRFQQEVNEAFQEEECPWRLSEGAFFQMDSGFLAVHVLAKTQELLRAEQFQGALNEFAEARADLQAGDYKDAITKACKSFESALKTVLGRQDGNASDLIRAFVAAGFCNDLPEKHRSAFGESVLMALPFLGNRLGRHGQGSEVVDVPRPYAELAVHLAGAFIQFVVQKHLAAKPKPETLAAPADDDVPF